MRLLLDTLTPDRSSRLSHPAAAAASTGAAQSEFARRAAKIGMGIHSTSQKLQKLAQLARRTSMFDDPAEEINELSTVVKQDIQVGGCGARAGGGGWWRWWVGGWLLLLLSLAWLLDSVHC